MTQLPLRDIPVVILCGGEGSRFGQMTQDTPKPLLPIGPEPILMHIMRIYALHGFRKFILCLGYKGMMIKDYFLDRDLRLRDFTLNLTNGSRQFMGQSEPLDWDITFAETGANSQTGARMRRIAKHVDAPLFCATYGDGVANIDLTDLVRFHVSHGKIGTLTGVRTRSQFGELRCEGDSVRAFVEKPPMENLVNGGFFVFNREFLDRIDDDPDCILEREPMVGLAAEGQLKVYDHAGYWQCMDTFKDYRALNEMFDAGDIPWKSAGPQG
ncbi:sugar phosphate nucleotidyltransferase [Pseudorhodobacter sp.]|uniref:sugar phosphate nucleotidyltransferase n=1 Tax=Pseudorhodobacter sp. TaxID=1934400 RepID=UPI002648EC5D|nr:sugar phosphate nucleotidyltransferase [Pseudorhodobacter sp.]MDN5785906.1 NTP transferase domain-containing protein [Pseudorhodobacter sp.]